jgi:hypothetical protein
MINLKQIFLKQYIQIKSQNYLTNSDIDVQIPYKEFKSILKSINVLFRKLKKRTFDI